MSGLTDAERIAACICTGGNPHSYPCRQHHARVGRIVAVRVAAAEQRITEALALADRWERRYGDRPAGYFEGLDRAASDLRAALARPTDEATP